MSDGSPGELICTGWDDGDGWGVELPDVVACVVDLALLIVWH